MPDLTDDQRSMFERVAAHFDRLGESDIAASLYREACFAGAAPAQDIPPHTILLVAAEMHRSGRLQMAERIYRHLLQGPSPAADVYSLLGYALHQLGHPAEGMQKVAMAIALDPRVANYHNHFGLTLQALGRDRWPDAVAAYLRALELEPGHPQAMENLLQLLGVMDDLPPVADRLRHSMDDAAAPAARWLELGDIYQRHQHHEGAAHAYGRAADALAGQPAALVDTLLRLGAVHQNHKQLEAACEVYGRLLALEPGHRVARERLADSQCEMGEFALGIAGLEALHAEAPSAALRARIDLAFPCIADSVEEIDAARSRLEAALDRYLASAEPVPPVLSPGFFYLAYHARNDRDLQRKGALLARKSMPHLVHTAPWVAQYRGPGARIKVGVASSLFYNHSIGRTTRGIVDRLDRARFEVVLVCLPPRRHDEMARAMRAAADSVIDLQGDLQQDRETLAQARFDALFYVDIGMNPYQAMLAHARLAPLQCTHFGHPETSGIPTVDWWISVDALEPPQAAQHYSERLHLLRKVPQFSYYYRPQLPAQRKARADYGLRDDEHVYICPQYIFKVHPEFDLILEKILRADPSARILFTRSPVAHWSVVVRRRLERRIGPLVDRITHLPGLALPDLMNLEQVCDGVLDTLHFNGYNTTLEAWSAHAPVVTLPGEFQRGMHTAGMYRFIDMTDLIARDADDYARLVHRLGHDAPFNRAMREKIASRIGVLFENLDVVREYERFFEEKLADIARGGAGAQARPAPAEATPVRRVLVPARRPTAGVA